MDEDLENLPRDVSDPEGSPTRRERRKIYREEQKDERQKAESVGTLKKWSIILGIVALVVAGGYWLFKDASKPLPGQEVADMGQEHVTDIFGVSYNSNPPTSGSHFAVWAKPGIYDRFISDGYFIHSMEHGYVIIWYDCSKLSSGGLLREVYAHDEPGEESTESGQLLMHMKFAPTGAMSWFTPENPPEEEIPLPESFKSESCKGLVSELSEFTKVAQRVIVVPRQNMDSAIALTAWGRIDKLDSVDKNQIEAFIKAFHNKGPERTNE